MNKISQISTRMKLPDPDLDVINVMIEERDPLTDMYDIPFENILEVGDLYNDDYVFIFMN